jgi:hypothetical protein
MARTTHWLANRYAPIKRGTDMAKTSAQLVAELVEAQKQGASHAFYADIIDPVKIDDLIDDIRSMDDDMIGEGDWCECTADGIPVTR